MDLLLLTMFLNLLLQMIFQADLAAFGGQSPELAKRYRAG